MKRLTAREVMIRELEKMRDQFKPQRGLLYRGPADFVLQHGEFYTEQREFEERRLPGSCYGLALFHAAADGLRYVEGYALNRYTLQAVPHAWNLDAVSRVIDHAWHKGMALVYMGIEFSAHRADDALWNGEACVVNDFKRGHPLLRQRWQGEPPHITWPYSERLDFMRKRDRGAFFAWAELHRREVPGVDKILRRYK